jgi:CRISP-associated protein Cas1
MGSQASSLHHQRRHQFCSAEASRSRGKILPGNVMPSPRSPSAQSGDLLPARMVNEYVYCPRLAYLEWVQGEWDDNADTVDGRYVHRRVDLETAADLPSGEANDPARSLTARSIMLSSDSLGAIAKMDLIEISGKKATPVDTSGTGPRL